MTLTRKLLCVAISGVALGAAVPAFADRGHGTEHGRGYARGYNAHYGHERVTGLVQRPYYVAPPPVYYAPPRVFYRPAPVYYTPPPVVYAPAPGYHARSADLGTVVGAVAGGLIGSQFGYGDDRIAATAIGAVAGGLIGSRY